MSVFEQLFGRQAEPRNDSARRATPHLSGVAEAPPIAEESADKRAIERYRYLLRTASPEAIEGAHAEAFAQLTTEQRRLVLEGLSQDLSPQERTDRVDPQSLARLATRAELRRPGTLERTFGGLNTGGTGIGLGGFLAFDFLSTIAGVVVGSAIADAIFTDSGTEQESTEGAAAGDDSGTEDASAGGDGDFAANDLGGDDFAGDFSGDFGGDF